MSQLKASEALAELRDADLQVTEESADLYALRLPDDEEAPAVAMRVKTRPEGTKLVLYVRHGGPTPRQRGRFLLGALLGGATLGAIAFVVTGSEVVMWLAMPIGAVLGAGPVPAIAYSLRVPKEQRPAVRELFRRVHDAVRAGEGRDAYRSGLGQPPQ